MRRNGWQGLWIVGFSVLVLGVAGSGCGDDDGACTDACEVLSSAQCGGTVIQICSQGADGCLVWADSTDCAESLQVCDDSMGNPQCTSDCTDQCTTDGATQCNGTAVETCLELPNGCLDWTETSDCADLSLFCEDYTGDASCMDECVDECVTLTDTQCNATVIESCATGPDGCLDWEGGTDCADTSELCDDSIGDAGCVINCALSGPAMPAGAAPAHQAVNVDETSVTSVNWADSNGAASYDIYFGDTCPPPTYPDASFQNVTTSELTGLTLATDTAYCWQVVAIDSECSVEGPVWTFHTTCNDPVAGPPTVTSTLATLYAPGTTADTYTLTFSEDVSGVITGLTWTSVTGSGTLGTVTQVDPQTYTVPFSGVADGDQYILTVTTAVNDGCGNPLTAALDIAINIDAVSAGTGLTCADAVDLSSIGVPNTTVGQFTDSGVPGGSCDTTADNTAWYTYSPAVSGWYDINAVNSDTASIPYSRIAVFETGSCSPYGAEVGCVTDSSNSASITSLYLDAAMTYLIMFYTDGVSYVMVDPTIDIVSGSPPPVGGVCSDPIDLDTTGVPHQELGSFDAVAATGGSCDTVADNAVWYNFTPPVTGWYTVDATNSDTASNPYSRIAIFETTTCSPYGAEVVCQTETSNIINMNNIQLDAGITYTVMFYTDGASYFMVDPTIDIRAQLPPPAGSLCGTAIDLDTVGVPHQATGQFNFVAQSGGSCDTTADNAAWYTYTPVADGWYQIDFTNNGTSTSNRLAVFEGNACAPLGLEAECETFTTSSFVMDYLYLQGGVTYTVVAYTSSASATMVDPLIDIGPGPVPPAGADCNTAIDLDSVGVPHQAVGNFALTGQTGGSCDTLADNVIWFTYTSSADDWYQIDVTNDGTSLSNRLAVFEGNTCTPLGTELGCVSFANASFALDHVWMQAGVTYLIAMYTGSTTDAMVDPTIDIGPGAAPPPGETCALPASVGASNHSVDGNNHDCWTWGVNSGDTINDHVFTCDSVVGGDVVIEFTTSASATTLAFDASINNWQTDGYIAIEITDGPCTTGSSQYCFSPGSTGTFTDTGTVSVQPNTAYYIWLGDGYSGHYLPDVNVCLWDY